MRHEYCIHYKVLFFTLIVSDQVFPTLMCDQLELSRDGDLMTNGHHPECRVTLQRNLIRIVTNSMEILVEFGGFVGYFIDVLVKSQEPYTQTVAFIHKYIRNPITKLSNSTKGMLS